MSSKVSVNCFASGGALQSIQLRPGQEDVISWRWEPSGHYSSKSACKTFFLGSLVFPCAEAIWKARAPLKCKLFLWLAVHRRCWTADRLQHRGLQNHSACVSCGFSQETIDHLLVGCAATSQVWTRFLARVVFAGLVPIGQPMLEQHWLSSRDSLPRQKRRGFDSCFILVVWMIWKERNNRVFNNVIASIGQLLQRIHEEHCYRRLAGAHGWEALSHHE